MNLRFIYLRAAEVLDPYGGILPYEATAASKPHRAFIRSTTGILVLRTRRARSGMVLWRHGRAQWFTCVSAACSGELSERIRITSSRRNSPQ